MNCRDGSAAAGVGAGAADGGERSSTGRAAKSPLSSTPSKRFEWAVRQAERGARAKASFSLF